MLPAEPLKQALREKGYHVLTFVETYQGQTVPDNLIDRPEQGAAHALSAFKIRPHFLSSLSNCST
jgi:hypothetical protein